MPDPTDSVSSEPIPHNPKDSSTPITGAFIKSYAADQLLLDCPKIVLTQHLPHEPRIIRGKGMISLLGHSQFQLRMYSDGASIPSFEHFKSWAKWVQGEVIPEHDYFNLEATDLSGNKWQNQKILIDPHGSNGEVITATFNELTYRVSGLTPTLAPSLRMYFFQTLDIPYTKYLDTTTRSGDKMLERSVSLDMTSFEIDTLHFDFKKVRPEESTTILIVHSDSDAFPEAIEARIEECLRYVTFRPLSCCIVDKQNLGTRDVIVRPRHKTEKGLFDEPLDSNPAFANDYWRLFSDYFRHIASYTDRLKYHPLSAQLFPVISPGTKQLHIAGLLVSVAVEGILNSEFPDLGKPSGAFITNLNHVLTLIRRIKCIDKTMSARFTGAVNAMKSARAKDKLKVLAEQSVVTKAMVDAWDELRNTTAHASIHVDEGDIQALWSRCNTVYTLLNKLVFLAIGYSGKYRDYSARDWPVVDFRAS